MKKKWYLQTWFICLLFALWFLIVPGVVGLVLLIMQILDSNKVQKKYGEIDSLDSKISSLEQNYNQKELNFKQKLSGLESSIKSKQQEREGLYNEIAYLEKEAICKQYIFSDYDTLTSEECKNELALLKRREQDLIEREIALNVNASGNKKEINANKKQILRCFNSECDNALIALSIKNIDAIRSKMTKSFETLNKIFIYDGIQLSHELLQVKLEELNLVYTFELKREQERVQQKAIKEQMIEEEKVRREIERQKAKLEKDQTQCSNEIKKLMGYLQETQSDVEKQLYIDKIKELEVKLKQLEADKETILEREANARAGYVYIISNIGAFGQDVYKIGMTRRLEPMDRVKELGSASVPFEFDVHAMIFSDDAPSLENALHQKFEKQSVNRVNLRKEFFRVTLNEIESAVKEKYNNTVKFTRVPVAKEYNATLEILKGEQSA